MKNNLHINLPKKLNFRKMLVPMVWFCIGMLFIVMLSNSADDYSKQKIRSVEIDIDNLTNNHFLTSEKVLSFITNYYQTEDLNVSVGDINLYELEWLLQEHPYIDEADLYLDMQGSLFIKIRQKFPILRIWKENGQDYYLSNLGDKMPGSNDFTARVPVVTGKIDDNGKDKGELTTTMLQDLYDLAQFVKKHKVLNALIEQIHIESANRVVLVPKVGDYQIVLGDFKNKKKKFMDLLALYKYKWSKEGWQDCKYIDVSYGNQIVCSAK